ncbi:YitT family protein [Paenibacillus sp. FJAT-26967]|uniref:YitT family protein n=1 Tax=Paenibacillus sp. FJAT-26967 TaxID=1729690 RepID=UPI0008387768|nr:YitT family protein [Paenibacillus sp. FJAT-26967]
MKLVRVPAGPAKQPALGRLTRTQWGLKLLMVVLGSFLAAVGLELFLIPNGMIVGGMTGVSALFAHFTEMRLGLFLFVLNLPLILLSYRRVRREWILVTFLGLLVFSVSTLFLHPVPALLENGLPAALGGGLALGLGIGLVVRYGGTLDTLEMTNGTWKLKDAGAAYHGVMLLNLMILTGAGFIYGWEQAMYSILAYLLAYEMVHFAMRGFTVHRRVNIISLWPEDIEQEVERRLGRIAQYPQQPADEFEDNRGALTGEEDAGGARHRSRRTPHSFSYVVHFMEMPKFKAIVGAADPLAVITVEEQGVRRDGRPVN